MLEQRRRGVAAQVTGQQPVKLHALLHHASFDLIRLGWWDGAIDMQHCVGRCDK
jgi:hypothetical protein